VSRRRAKGKKPERGGWKGAFGLNGGVDEDRKEERKECLLRGNKKRETKRNRKGLAGVGIEKGLNSRGGLNWKG